MVKKTFTANYTMTLIIKSGHEKYIIYLLETMPARKENTCISKNYLRSQNGHIWLKKHSPKNKNGYVGMDFTAYQYNYEAIKPTIASLSV